MGWGVPKKCLSFFGVCFSRYCFSKVRVLWKSEHHTCIFTLLLTLLLLILLVNAVHMCRIGVALLSSNNKSEIIQEELRSLATFSLFLPFLPLPSSLLLIRATHYFKQAYVTSSASLENGALVDPSLDPRKESDIEVPQVLMFPSKRLIDLDKRSYGTLRTQQAPHI